MDEITSGLDPDELMDLDEADGSDIDEDDEELIDDPITSQFLLSSGPGSTTTSVASSPINEDFSPPFNFTGKPLNIKRGRGRPRREGGKPLVSRAPRASISGIARVRKPRLPGFTRRGGGGGSRSIRQPDRSDFEMSLFTPSPIDDSSFLDPETGSFSFPERDRPIGEELPYFPEHWTGKVCAFCNLGERSQLGQGEMLRLNCPEDFSPLKVAAEQNLRKAFQMSDRDSEDKSPRGPAPGRRQKSFNKCRHPTNSEHVDELTIIGFNEIPDVSLLYDPNGQFYVHRSCALWSCGVIRAENSALLNVGQVVLQSSSNKCSFCNHFGASVTCNMDGCSKIYHLPCATAAGAFQELVSVTTFCSNHLDKVAMLCESSVCFTCRTLGDVANLMYCSTCGAHYHGTCVGLAQLPSVRAGWQCRKCRCCQVCRITGDESKLMSCEQCDKVYHAGCQRPIVTSIPKYGWKCRCCRVCGDCGSRTPGAGLSSRWHAHYTVCDSCYQQRNKGYSCPLCHKAYRAHAHREMVQCTNCRKFVHGTCDPDADLGTYHQKREANPDYEYVCLHCKTNSTRQVTTKRASTDDPGELSASQESLYDDISEFDITSPDEFARNMGLGKGKPYSASKIAKKRLGYPTGATSRSKGAGKALPGKVGFMKRSRLTDFGRKRGHKAKMRGVFGVPGVGLQRPTADGRNDEEPGVENRLVLCSAKDKFILTQDICVMCGAMGTDQEGCLIACVQCGQCYHPYCLNVKVTKVILQKGWRCLDCTVCEGCGQRNDESRLILCDDCDVSYHIYCMDPPLEYVPHGNWKCKWCAACRTCGATDPGFNCTWMNSCTECGPCASHVSCPSCSEPYCEGDLIIQCVQCERWLHGACDYIRTEEDAEKCAEDGYNCMLCRPRDVPPPHLIPPPAVPKPPTPTKSPEITKNTNYFVDGVYLSEFGHSLIKSLALEHHGTRKKRKKIPTVQDKEAGIMATIESVVAGGTADNMLEDSAKLELVDIKDEPQELYKEGMIWTKEDGPPPEGFTIFTMENGIAVLRRKRQRNLQKLGIGGFLVRMRGIRSGQDNDDIDVLQGQANLNSDLAVPLPGDGDKPRRKPIRRKPKSKLVETFPSYLQEAFFGKDLMDVVECKKVVESGSSDDDKDEKCRSIKLSQDELMAVAAVTAKQEIQEPLETKENIKNEKISSIKEEEDDNTEDLKDVLALPGDLLDTDLVNSIINEDDEELTKNNESLEALDPNMPDDSELADTLGSSGNSKDTKDELSDILGPHFNLDSISNINSKDVEDIFKGVLTDESQESQESNAFPLQSNSLFNGSVQQAIPQHPVITPPIRPTTLPAVNQSNLNSPVSFPPPSPYHSEYSNSPQFSPAFSEPPSPWVNVSDASEIDSTNVGVPSTYNQRSSEKMKADESLGNAATISAVLYANMNHPEWKKEFPVWSDRYKHIIKKWRTLSQDQKAPYLQHARDNRSQLRMKKAQQSQTPKEAATTPTSPSVSKPSSTIAAALVTTLQSALIQQTTMGGAPLVPPPVVPPTGAVTEVCTQSRPTLTPASASSVSVTPTSPSSPTTHQQFTVRGHFAGPGDRVGPAPNVTVNPHYQPAGDNPRLGSQQSSATDQQIRVLTPSEIMRTLPSLCQENYEPQALDQEKIALQQKSAREAEQERQWKQLQAMRQQQAQQQQHVIHEQRVQDEIDEVSREEAALAQRAIARVHNQITGDPMQQFLADQQQPHLQSAIAKQEPGAAAPPPSSSRHFLGLKSPGFPHMSMAQPGLRTPTPAQSPHNFAQSPATESNDPFIPSPTTPKPTFQPRLPADSFGQPATSRPQFGLARPPGLQGFTNPVRPDQDLNINRQLRELLQRQQFKKLDELIPGKVQQRVWPPTELPEGETPTATVVSAADTTFRQPLPPSVVRPRAPVAIGNRPIGGPGAVRMGQLDGRMQGLDPRMRLILQQQQRLLHANPQNLQQQFVRFAPGGARPATVEQYEQLLHRQAQTQQARGDAQAASTSRPQVTGQLVQRQHGAALTSQSTTGGGGNEGGQSNEEGIPDNVTAELEKLEQETGTMVELQGVSEILGGLGDDDDELLAEMGADFNILEYADPELEALTGGKTNILDLELEEEPMKKDKRETPKAATATTEQQQVPVSTSSTSVATSVIKKEDAGQLPPLQPQETPRPIPPPPPLAAPQAQQSQQHMQHAQSAVPAQSPPTPQPPAHQPQFLTPQQIHQQMLHQVQQAAAQGKPMPPGSKMQTPDGIIGVVMHNNTVQLQVPPNYQQRLLILQQIQNQKLQMRLSQSNPRMGLQVGANQQVTGMTPGPRVAAPPPPPPPPYPGPPPPYPGSAQQQQQSTGLRMGPGLLPMGHFHPATPLGYPMHPHLQRKPLLLEEQPLLLEDLLEQEKREQEKLQNQPSNQEVSSSTGVESESALMSDHDFERLKADVFNSGPVGLATNNQGNVPHQPWQQTQNRPVPTATPQPTMEITTRVQMFNANLIPAPPLPPENIITEQDKQAQMLYEQWLNHQNNVLGQQLRYYETEVQKLRKSRKSLNSKQRQLRKSGNQLTETDAAELQRIAAEQAILQKHLESSRKQSRQHGMLIQEYRNKHPAKQQRQGPPEQIQSPLGPPASSPIHHASTSQSPMMSPSASPMTHHSPMNSPGPMISPSPGSGSMQNILQSPGSLGNSSGMSPGQVSGMQPSPRIGTPHSQSEGSPGSAQSPSQVCLPPPVPRMTSPQHRRVVTSPGAVPQMRFVSNALQQRVRMQSPMQNFQQKPGTPSPLHSPTSQQLNINQLQLQKQLQHQALLQQQQQQQQQGLDSNQSDPNVMHSQRAVQLLQHRNLIRQQQTIGQPQPLTPQQHQMMLQQQKQLAQQQQQQIAQIQAARLQQQQQQQNPPHSPLPPKSPMINQQIMSPHSMPPSPMQMPPKSPMMPSYGNNQPNPNSPAARSPAFHQGIGQPPSPMTHSQYQTPSSPMPMPRSPMVSQNQSPHGMRRPPSANSSPAMSDRPHSEENHNNPNSRTPYSIDHLMQDSMQNQNHNLQFNNDMVNNQVHFGNDSSSQTIFRENMQTGGGNPNNPCNPIPAPPCFGRFGYVKLGLRGGAPMWNYGRGAKRIPTPPTTVSKPEDKSSITLDLSNIQKSRKESHLNKVSILKKKTSTNFQGKVGSLVSTDYDNTDDSSCTPPETPPTLSSSSRGTVQKHIPRKSMEHTSKEPVMVLHSPENKQMDMMDYDDDTNTVLSAEVSLSSAAQNDHDDMVEIETLSQQDLAEGLSSPLESDQIPDEYLLFPGNMVVDMSGDNHYSDKDEEEVEEEYSGENMHIVIRSPTTSDDEFIMQSKTNKYEMVTHPDEFMNREGPESPDQEDADEEVLTNFEESDLAVLEQNKSPEDSISTKEDFEELIDEGSRKNNMTKKDNNMHKFNNTFNYNNNAQQTSQSQTPSTSRLTTVPQKGPPKISLINSPIVHSLANKTTTEKIMITPNTNPPSPKVTSLILTHNSNVRGNVLSVPKIVTSVSPAITIVSASTSQIASILPSKFTVPVISASAVRQLSNVKVIDKSSSSLSLSTHDSALPKQIFEDDSVSPDSSNCEDDKSKDSFDYKPKSASPEQEGKQPLFPKSVEVINMNSNRKQGVENKQKDNGEKPPAKRIEHLQITNLVTKGHIQKHRVPSPIISKTSSQVIIHNTPELKMTAQVIQETQTHMQINATAETIHSYDGSGDTKSVVISIPSPTPSQEQLLDNIALQALEHRRRAFESFEDVLDMIENIRAEPPAILEESVRSKESEENNKKEVNAKEVKEVATSKPETVDTSANAKSTIPQLSPLSQPTDLTTNMANASQQLRSLLSSLQTTSTSAATNVESVVKNFGNKVSSSASPTAMQPIVASRIIQQAGRQSPNVSNVNTVIVPNYKQKVTSTSNPRGSPNKPQVLTNQQVTIASNATTTLNLLTSRTVGGINLMPDHPKLPPVSTVNSVQQISSTVTLQSNSIQKPLTSSETRKPSLTLTAMLQNQPAATTTTKSTAESITAASLLSSPISLPRTGFTTALVQAQPNAVIPAVSSNASMSIAHNQIMSTISNMIMKTTSDTFAAANLLSSSVHLAKANPTTTLAQTQPNVVISTSSSIGSSMTNLTQNSVITPSYKPVNSTTNLLHTQLTRVVRAKSLDEPKEIKIEDLKQEPTEGVVTTTEDIKASIANCIKQELASGRYPGIYTPLSNRTEDSQNVLLKKLLQNTACASTQSPPPSAASTTVTSAPSTVARMPIRETSFVSSPPVEHSTPQPTVATSTVMTMPTQQLHIDVKKSLPPSRTPSRDELLSPQTPRSSCSQDSSLQTPPIVIKKELSSVNLPQPSPILTSHEVKKELMDESSQHSEVSDHSRSDAQIKEEMDSLESSAEKIVLDKEEIKKQKRRMYQQKRRQTLILNKELAGQPKKRPRKNSKIEEDYDTYIDGVLTQLRQLPTMNVSEPVLNRNHGIVAVIGAGDMLKLGNKNYSSQLGDLVGSYGSADLPGFSDFYSTKPYGTLDRLPEKPPASTQRGFYDQEFPLIRFDTDDPKKFDMFCREDTPDSILSSSSPECMRMEPIQKFLGLKLISDDEDDDKEGALTELKVKGRASPVVPMIKPIPIKLKAAGGFYLREDATDNKENIDTELLTKTKCEQNSDAPVKDTGNVTVTLTLTSSAAEDIMGVLRDLANILHIPAPTSYQIVERTSTPPGQKLGLYRTKGRDGKEGAPIDIQSILNGDAKFCKHCDVVILNNMIRRKVSDLPFLARDTELISDGDELYFCSSTCYMQFALMHRSPSISEDKAAEIIDHLSQKDKLEEKHKIMDSFDSKSIIAQRLTLGTKEIKKEFQAADVKDFSSYFQNFDNKFGKFQDNTDFKHLPLKLYKNIRYKFWIPGCLQPTQKHKRPTDKEIMELLYRLQITVTPAVMPEDTRKCMFCQGIGDGVADGPARLLNFEVDKWIHLNCGLWSDGVYETVNGALMNLENAISMSYTTTCIYCSRIGATIRCFKNRCSSVYHLNCAVKDHCIFHKNKTVYCTAHVPKNEKDNELTTLSVSRRVYVNRDENRQVASVMHHSDTNNILRVGSLIFLNVGHLLPHQLQNFHNSNYIYPIGYRIIRFYWSMRRLNKRCKYICSIYDACGRPEFGVLVQEQPEEDVEFRESTPKGAWQHILDRLANMRKEEDCLQMFPKFATGEDLFGLTEPAIVRVLESLPGIETLTDYKFKYGRNPLLELPLAINPSGAARTEPKLRSQMHWKRPHTQRTFGATVRPLFGPVVGFTATTPGELSCPYSKQFVHSKSSQYKKMKQDWKNNVYLARSKIQGLGLYAAKDLEKHTMVIEYIGEIIRTELAECREKQYDAKNRGIYMFRLDEERVVDATLSGGLARYINHSCNPNCVAEQVEVERDVRIIIFSKRRIQRGEELSYDYKFDIEDDQHKISCMCGAPNCRKWMN